MSCEYPDDKGQQAQPSAAAAGALWCEEGQAWLVFISPVADEEVFLAALCREYERFFQMRLEPDRLQISRPLPGTAPAAEQGGLATCPVAEALAFVTGSAGDSLAEFHAASIVAAARELRSCRENALRDPLTGIRNRRYAEEAFAERLAAARRYGHPLAIALLDIDDFKLCNAEGHKCGDRVLRDFALALQSGVRAADIFTRYGGDEFLLILPQCDAAAARTLLARLDAMIAAQDFTIGRPLSFSSGIASLGVDGDTPAQLLASADQRLLESKSNPNLN
jgi:diguanylate cyclase (GGDEF)-like protein